MLNSPAVGPRHTPQLLVPRRYHFFDPSLKRDASAPAGSVAHLRSGADEPIEGGQLWELLRVLRQVRYYPSVTVRYCP